MIVGSQAIPYGSPAPGHRKSHTTPARLRLWDRDRRGRGPPRLIGSNLARCLGGIKFSSNFFGPIAQVGLHGLGQCCS